MVKYFRTFSDTWNGFDERDRERCSGIGVLCQDRFGNRIGGDYPTECRILPTMDTVFGWRDKELREAWALLRTQNLKRFFVIPDEAKDLKFIPENFFWSRMTIEGRYYSYFLNRVLRVYYVREGGETSVKISG